MTTAKRNRPPLYGTLYLPEYNVILFLFGTQEYLEYEYIGPDGKSHTGTWEDDNEDFVLGPLNLAILDIALDILRTLCPDSLRLEVDNYFLPPSKKDLQKSYRFVRLIQKALRT